MYNELSVGFGIVVSAVVVVVVATDAADDVEDVEDVDGGLFLSNGLIRSDGFNVFAWNWL